MRKIFTLALFSMFMMGGVTMKAQNELVVGDVKVGDLITLSDGSQWYVGTNEVTNGSFDLDPAENGNNIVGWTVGDYKQMTTSNFAWFAEGGYDDGAYIQAKGHEGANGAKSIVQRWTLQTNTRYYLSWYEKNQGANNQYSPVVSLTSNESTGGGRNERTDKEDDGPTSNNSGCLIGMNGDSNEGVLGYSNYVEGEWAQTALSFESKEFTYLQFNARWLGSSHCFDGFFLAKLYDIETTSPSQVAYLALQSEINKLQDAIGNYGDYTGIADVLGDFPQETEINGTTIDNMTEDTALDDLQAAIEAIKKVIEQAAGAVASIESFNAVYDQAKELSEAETTYPGFDDFIKVLETYENYMNEGYASLDKEISAFDYVAVAIKNMEDAIEAYRKSQPASEDNPADYTYLIDNPTFVAKGAWYIGQDGGDQRLHTGLTDNEGNAMTAWNAWRGALDSDSKSVSINQDLIELPNGYYTVSADMCTQDGCITDQHVFANSSVQSADSPVMTKTGWEPYVWETLTTAKVLVVDGKLTIGAIGHGAEDTPDAHGGTNTDHRRGWFCISNFKLNYLGEASAEEYAAATANKFKEAEAYINTLHMAGDKATLLEAIAEAKAANDLDKLNEAIATGEASEKDYEAVLNGSYKTLQNKIAGVAEEVKEGEEPPTPYSDDAKELAQVPVDYMTNYLASAEATYKETGKITEVLRFYLNNLIPALQAVEAAQETITSEKGKGILTANIESVKEVLATYQGDIDALKEQEAALYKAITVAETSDVEVKDGADVTAYITNPTCDNTDTKKVPTGWTGTMSESGNSQYANKGQEVDGGDGFYMDAWNGTAGKLKYKETQVLEVPNGTYTLSAMMRTTGEGFYLYAIADEGEPVLAEAVAPKTPAKYIYGAEEDEVRTDDTYGALWCAAADKVMEKFGIEGPTESSNIYDLAYEQNGGSEECPEGIEEADWNIFKANNGIGRGWFINSLTVEVKNHKLELGVATGDAFEVEGIKAFTGTWLSADNFQLILDKEGDNEGWDVTTGITNIKTAPAAAGIYNLAGQRVDASYKGIVIKNGKKYLQK